VLMPGKYLPRAMSAWQHNLEGRVCEYPGYSALLSTRNNVRESKVLTALCLNDASGVQFEAE
jgi:hypothetical protein